MGRIVSVIFLIFFLESSISIVVEERPVSQRFAPSISIRREKAFNAPENIQNESNNQNSKVKKFDDFTIVTRETDPSKIFPTSLVQPVSSPYAEIHVQRAPLPHGYLSNFVDFKPIHENDNQVTIDLTPRKHKFDGYTYSIPDSNDLRLPNSEPKKYDPYYPSDDLVKALLTLDKVLKPLLKTNSYNSALHPPLNPVLALVLSRYGKYISGKSHLYSYTATNNMHNNRPFGQYKHECDENPIFVK